MPSSYAARKARTAISPRLATSTLPNMTASSLKDGGLAEGWSGMTPSVSAGGSRRSSGRPVVRPAGWGGGSRCGAVRGARGALAGDRADPVGELGGDLPVLRRAGGAGVVGQGGGVDGFGVGLVQAGEADAGLAGAVHGDDAVVGAAAEALHVADGDGAVGLVVGDLGQCGGEPAAELAGGAGVVAGGGAAGQPGPCRGPVGGAAGAAGR